MRALLLLRHGRTDWNLERRIQGQHDSMLDDLGHAQARAAAKEVAVLRPARLWSSDLTRTTDTAAYVAEACGLPVRTDPRLREFHLGERQGLTHDEYAATHPDEYDRYRTGRYDVAPGAEPPADVAARMAAVLTDLVAVTEPGELSVAVSHGGSIRLGLTAMLGWPVEAAHSLDTLGNACWAVLAESPHRRRWTLAAYNRCAPGASDEP